MASSATTLISPPFSVHAHPMPYAAYSGTETIPLSTALGLAMSYHNRQFFGAPEISC